MGLVQNKPVIWVSVDPPLPQLAMDQSSDPKKKKKNKKEGSGMDYIDLYIKFW